MNTAYLGLVAPSTGLCGCNVFPGMHPRYYCTPHALAASYYPLQPAPQQGASPPPPSGMLATAAPLQPFYACSQQVILSSPMIPVQNHYASISSCSSGDVDVIAHPSPSDQSVSYIKMEKGPRGALPYARKADVLKTCCSPVPLIDARSKLGYVPSANVLPEAADAGGRGYLPEPPPLSHEEQATPSYDNTPHPVVHDSRWCPQPQSAGDLFTTKNSCHVCGKSYARQSTLKTHLRTHNGEKPYQCNICQKSFTQAANLTAHLRTHSGEKPFKCPVCNRGFSQSSSVTTHLRTHSGDRPYKCNVCVKGFADSSTLTKHYRTHTGEKPYYCKVCEARFSQSGNLNRHMKTHRN